MKTSIIASLLLTLFAVSAHATVTVKLNEKGEVLCTVTCAKGGSWTGPCKDGIQTGELYKGDKNICGGEPDLNKPIVISSSIAEASEAPHHILVLDLAPGVAELESGEEAPASSLSGRNFRCVAE